MVLVIGGRAQGKLKTTLARWNVFPEQVCDGAVCQLEEYPLERVLNHAHLLVRRLLKANVPPHEWFAGLVANNPDIIIIMDEVGCGIVPIDPAENEWREAVGRTGCMLAARAAYVERIYAGIVTVIKENASI